MKRIKLFGDLEKFKSDWTLDVKTPAEAMRAIEANRPGFVKAADAGDYVLILVDEQTPENTRQVTLENALHPWGDELLVVVPRVGGDAIGAVIVGAISAAFAATAAGAIVAAIIDVVIAIAVSMIASLISGTNDGMSASDAEPYQSKPSYLFNGVVNTTKQGHRIPILYGGPLIVGSMVLSSQIHVKDIPV